MPVQRSITREIAQALRAIGEINGVEAANRAVDACAPGDTMIFLTRSEYDDLMTRGHVTDPVRYKGKTIWITSDDPLQAKP